MSATAPRRFRLTELLVVLGVLAVLVGLMLPATRRIREPANRMKCQNNLKQLLLGLNNYEDNHGPPFPSTERPERTTEGAFPTGCIGPGARPDERLSWMVAILPFIEQDGLYRRFDESKGYAGNLSPAGTRVAVYVCPSAPASGDGVTNYVAMAGLGADAAGRPAGAAGNGFLGYDRRTTFAMIKDGTSDTIALAETRTDVGPWARGGPSTLRGFDPADLPVAGDGRPFGGHSNGFQAGMADGSVRFVRDSIDPKRLAAALTIDGGEPFNLD
jgi:hypothetical protein